MQSCSHSQTGRSLVSQNNKKNNNKYNSCIDMGNNTSTIEFTPNNSYRLSDHELTDKNSCRINNNKKQSNT